MLRIFNSCIQIATKLLFPETVGTYWWNLFHFILNGSRDMVYWKCEAFFGPPCSEIIKLWLFFISEKRLLYALHKLPGKISGRRLRIVWCKLMRWPSQMTNAHIASDSQPIHNQPNFSRSSWIMRFTGRKNNWKRMLTQKWSFLQFLQCCFSEV